MAQKRMFSLQVVDTDFFLDMPTSAQALYFHLGMHGDDDGFVSAPRKIARASGCNDDDMRLLAAKGYIIPFDSGVVVITDWRINNTLQNDRYKETVYLGEKSMLHSEKNGRYLVASTLDTECIRSGSKLESQRNLTQHNQTEHSKTENVAAKPPTHNRFSPPGVDEVRAYCVEKGYSVDPERFVNYYTSIGWRVGKNTMKNWKAAVANWHGKEEKKNGKAESKPLWTVGTVV